MHILAFITGTDSFWGFEPGIRGLDCTGVAGLCDILAGITTTRLRTFRLYTTCTSSTDISSTDISSTTTFLVEIEAGVMKRILYQ